MDMIEQAQAAGFIDEMNKEAGAWQAIGTGFNKMLGRGARINQTLVSRGSKARAAAEARMASRAPKSDIGQDMRAGIAREKAVSHPTPPPVAPAAAAPAAPAAVATPKTQSNFKFNPVAAAGAAGVVGSGLLIARHFMGRAAQRTATRSALQTAGIAGGVGVGLGAGYGMMRNKN